MPLLYLHCICRCNVPYPVRARTSRHARSSAGRSGRAEVVQAGTFRGADQRGPQRRGSCPAHRLALAVGLAGLTRPRREPRAGLEPGDPAVSRSHPIIEFILGWARSRTPGPRNPPGDPGHRADGFGDNHLCPLRGSGHHLIRRTRNALLPPSGSSRPWCPDTPSDSYIVQERGS